MSVESQSQIAYYHIIILALTLQIMWPKTLKIAVFEHTPVIDIDASSPGNPYKYSHKPYITARNHVTTVHGSQFCRWHYRSVIIQIIMVNDACGLAYFHQ